jgi:uncharacterized protein
MTPLVIIDTNVLVAGLLTSRKDSPTAALVDAMLHGSLMYLLSPDLLVEYRAVLLRQKIRTAHQLSEQEVDSFLAELVANAIWREPPPTRVSAPDKNDSHLWALLACEPNSVLVTGDELLLKNPPSGRLVHRPAEYIASNQARFGGG